MAQNPCEMGMADVYPCEGIDLQSFLQIDEIGGGANMNDVWGWTSGDGREIALAGKSGGLSFVDITDPVNPIYLGELPTQTVPSLWRDVKVYEDYAFIVSEAGEHGMQVIDLNQVIDTDNIPATFSNSAFYGGFGNCHNIVINEESGYAYAVGTTTFSGGLHIIDISNPTSPVIAGGYGLSGYVHDAQVVNYDGPDADYSGKEVAFCCNGGSFAIVDVTAKDDCELISEQGYDFLNYVHQGWLTEDSRYFIQNDETDETGEGFNTRTHLWDVQDLDSPVYLGFYEADVMSSDHNLYTKDGLAYMSNYRSGLRVVDLSFVEDGVLSEVASFDTYPPSDEPGFGSGSWSNYPYFESGNIPVTEISAGLFIVKLQDSVISSVGELDRNIPAELLAGPIPATDFLRLEWKGLFDIESIRFYDAQGRLVRELPLMQAFGSAQLSVNDLSPGTYFLSVSGQEDLNRSVIIR